MLWQWSVSVIAELIASAILLVLAIYFPWRDLNRQARLTGVTLVFFCSLWILSHAIEIGFPVASYKESLVGLQLVLGMMALTFWLFYILHYLGPRKLLARRIYILFGIMPLIAILALSTNNVYGLMWTEVGLDSQNPYLPLQPTYGIIYWACMVYVAMLTITGSFFIIWNIISHRYSYRRESIYLLIAAVLPLITAFIEVLGLLSFMKLSVGLSSWTACIGAIILILNLPKFHLEQVIPIARDITFERIGDCILVLDMQNRVLDLNPAAEQLIGYKISDAFGLSIERIWPYQSTPMMPFNKMVKAGEELVLEQDGKQRTYDPRISTISDSGGRLTSKVVLLTDITERRQAEESRRSEQLMLARTEGIAHIGSWEWDIATDTVTWSDELFRIFQRDSQEGAPSFAEHPAFYYPDDMARLKQAVEAAVADGTPYELELRAIRKDGETRVCIARGVAEMAPGGRAVRLFGSLQDITERKQAEESLKASEAQYRLLSEHTTDTIWLMDMDLNFIYNSPSVEKLRGFTAQEIKEMSWQQQVTPESLKLATEVISKEIPSVLAEPDYNPIILLELEYTCKNGTTVWAESKFSIIRDESGRPVSILGEARDITERRKSDELLRESEEQYRWLSEHITDGVWLLDMNLKPTYQSPSMEKLTGFTHEELMELPFERRVTPASLKLASELFFELMPRIMADPDYNPINTLELAYYCKDGTTLWMENKLSGIRDENGKPVSILAEVRDITAHRLAEEKLRKSYDSLKKTLDDAIDTMAKIVETRDPYTAGHQHKVGDLAIAIAREMKLEDTRIDQLRMAAVIHDIGKMYVPSDILSKPGRLSDIEFSLIKTHPQSGYDIVKGMDFPCNVAKAVLQHHERLDGSGYPNQLKGEDTLLEAKILAVADVIEAMASHRPYRPALGIDKALEEISKNKGKLYDPDVADACLELFNSGRFALKTG